MVMKISSKLLLSFCFINLLIILSSALVYHQLGRIEASQEALLGQALPALQRDEASQKALIATVSSLRAYLILGKDPAQGARIKQEWEQAGRAIEQQGFTPALSRALKSFKGAQEKVWALAHTEDNLPAHTLMLLEAGPLAEAALDQLQSIANEEVATPQEALPGDRRLLLKQVGDAYNGLANALSALRDFLISGDKEYRDKYQDYYQFHLQRVAELKQQQANFTEAQKGLWTLFEEMSAPFAELVGQVIARRQAPDWDQANHLMATDIEPALTQLASQLASQVTQTRGEVDKIAGKLAGASQAIHRTLLLATTSVILLGTLVALLFSRRLTRDIASLVNRAGQVADGRLSREPLPVLRQAHAQHPFVAGLVADGVGRVAHAQPGVAALVCEQRRPAQPAGQKFKQALLAASQVFGVHLADGPGFGQLVHQRVEAVHQGDHLVASRQLNLWAGVPRIHVGNQAAQGHEHGADVGR